MIILRHTVGTPEQEDLIAKLAGVIEDYASETAGPRDHTDDILIMGVLRRTLRRLLPRPLKELKDINDPLSNSLFKECMADLISYFNLEKHEEAIIETCTAIFNEWKKRISLSENPTPDNEGVSA